MSAIIILMVRELMDIITIVTIMNKMMETVDIRKDQTIHLQNL